MKCKFNMAWVGECQNKNPCDKHKNIKCSICGKPATRECEETYQFVCGHPLCNDCKCKCMKPKDKQ